MYPLILFIKSYKPDFQRTEKLLASVKKHNVENIPVVISVNDVDYDFFKNHLTDNFYQIIKDSSIVTTEIKDGWRYQQIIKAHVYRLQICKNYLCIDADSEFIRDFYHHDFLYDDETPYTIMHESKSFLEAMDSIGKDSEHIFFKEALRATRPIFGNKGKEWDYGPSPYLWSCKVWEHLIEVYLQSENKTFEDLFHQIDQVTSPSECVIYGEYLLKTKLIAIYPIEGLFKVYHYKEQYRMEEKFHHIDLLKKVYMGVIFQSNWADKKNFLTRIFKRF